MRHVDGSTVGFSADDVQGERSLNPRWEEIYMPAAMDSQLHLFVKATTTDSEVTQHIYPIPEDHGEWQELASTIMNEARGIGSTGNVSFINPNVTYRTTTSSKSP